MARAARSALLLGLLALAVILGVAAWALWDTDVPEGLRLPEVEASAVLDADMLEEARDFERFLRISFLVSLVVVIAVFVGYARWGGRFVTVGYASGVIPGIPLNLVLVKGVVVLGFHSRMSRPPNSSATRTNCESSW